MSQLGQLLRETRLKNKISLDELQETTKIRKGYLEAIEDGNYRILPGSFYVKAFIRTYSEALGIDPVEALSMYKMEATPEPEQEAPVEPTIRKRNRNSSRNTEKWSRIASTVLVISFVVLIIIVIYYFNYNNSNRSPNSSAESNKITDKASPPTIEFSPTPTPTPSATPVPTLPPVVAELKSMGKEGTNEVYEVTNADKMKISLSVVGKECWVSVTSTDANNKKTTLFSGALKNGDAKEWEATSTTRIVLGAAGAVELKVNDIVVPVGDSLNVRNFKFDIAKP